MIMTPPPARGIVLNMNKLHDNLINNDFLHVFCAHFCIKYPGKHFQNCFLSENVLNVKATLRSVYKATIHYFNVSQPVHVSVTTVRKDIEGHSTVLVLVVSVQ